MIPLSGAREVIRVWNAAWYWPVMVLPPVLSEPVLAVCLCLRALAVFRICTG